MDTQPEVLGNRFSGGCWLFVERDDMRTITLSNMKEIPVDDAMAECVIALADECNRLERENAAMRKILKRTCPGSFQTLLWTEVIEW
jgi:hypothetical protein